MAFQLANWGVLSGNAALQTISLQGGSTVGAPNIFTYTSSTDNINTISSPDYFTPVAFQIRVGDGILIDGTDKTEWFKISEVDAEAGTVLIEVFAGPDEGSVTGPVSSTLDALAVWNNTTGTVLRNSNATVDSSGNFGIFNDLNIGGNTTTKGNLSLENASSLLFYNGTNTRFVAFTTGTLSANSFYTWPLAYPASSGYVLSCDTSGNMSWIASGGGGTVTGPGSSTNTAIARWSGTTGAALLNSGVTIDGSNNVVVPGSVTNNGLIVSSANTLTLSNSGNTGAFSLSAAGQTAGATKAYVWPTAFPSINNAPLLSSTAGALSWGSVPLISGPGTTTTTAIARWNGTTGASLSNSSVTIDASNNVVTAGNISGAVINSAGGVNVSSANSIYLANSSNTGGFSLAAIGHTNANKAYAWPTNFPTISTAVLQSTSTGTMLWSTTPLIAAPGTTTTNAIAKWNSTTGAALANSNVTIDASNNIVTTGTVTTGGISVTSAGQISFNNSGNTFATALRGGASTTNTVYTLPITVPTANNQMLICSTGSAMTWSTVTADGSGNLITPGTASFTGTAFTNSIIVQSASSVNFNNAGNTFFTAIRGGAATVNQTYTLPIVVPFTSGQILLTSSTGAMSWSQCTIDAAGSIFPTSVQVLSGNCQINSGNKLVLNSTGNIIYTTLSASTATATVDYVLPVAGPTSNGQVLSSTTSGTMSWVSNAALPYVNVTSTPVTVAANTIYFVKSGGTILNMPASMAEGSVIEIVGTGTAWALQLTTGQTVSLGTITSAVSGVIESTDGTGSIRLYCTIANTTFWVVSSTSSITILQ